MRAWSVIVAAAIGLALGSPAISAEADLTAPALTVAGLQYQGTGCTAGSVSAVVSQDGRSLSVNFGAYNVEAGMRSPVGQEQGSKTCDLDIALNIPAGWSVGLSAIDGFGFADLSDPGVMGLTYVDYAFAGQAPVVLANAPLRGAWRHDYQLHVDLPLQNVNWSSCAPVGDEPPGIQTLKLGTEIDVTALGYSYGTMRGLAETGMLQHRYQIAWQACSTPQPTSWLGTCTASLATLAGRVINTFTGSAYSSTAEDAIARAGRSAVGTCEIDRANDPNLQCRVDSGSCTATRAEL